MKILLDGEDLTRYVETVGVDFGVREVDTGGEDLNLVSVGRMRGSGVALRPVGGTRLQIGEIEFEVTKSTTDPLRGDRVDFEMIETDESFSRRRAKGS